jgi:uncharacterized protein (DUF2062 family)
MAKNFFHRRFRYIYLRLIRLKDQPHELALGMAIGIFIGMTPTIPFHTVVAVALALIFKASKITAAVGTWICNPLTIYPIYKYSYEIGSFILRFDHNEKILRPLVEAINNVHLLDIATTIVGAGGMVAAAFLLGGILLGAMLSVPSYFLSFHCFRVFDLWRKSRGHTRAGASQGPL